MTEEAAPTGSTTTADKDAETRARARIGSTIDGKWHLDAILGVGGMAAVYAGTHRNGTRAAVKVLHQEVALNGTLKTRFLREGYVANKIGHPNIVRVLDDDEAPDGTVYLVMELLDGESLQDVITSGRKLSETEILRIAFDVLDALEAAHAKDVIHRDLKPGNLLLLSDGTVKLLDFGIAKVRESTAGMPTATTLAALGTPGFMPPEQARGRWDSVDARADVWALGATMFALLTGKFVHEEETTNEQLLAAMTKPAPRLREKLPDVTEDLAKIVDRALMFERDQRYATAAEMKLAIAGALRQRGASIPPSMPVADSSRVVINPSGTSKATTPTSLVDYEAATLSAPTTDGAAVADVERRRSGAPGRRGLGRMHVAGAAAVIALVAGGAWMTSKPRSDESRGATGSAVTAPTPSSAPPETTPPAAASAEPLAPSASATPSDGAPQATASTAASSSARPVSRPAAAAAVPRASSVPHATTPSGAATPAASVDIFNKRR